MYRGVKQLEMEIEVGFIKSRDDPHKNSKTFKLYDCEYCVVFCKPITVMRRL